MQSATNSAHPAEDLHSILNRFQSWAGKQPEDHTAHKPKPAGVREIPMEEALRQLRSRRATSAAAIADKAGMTQGPTVPQAPETKAETGSASISLNLPSVQAEKMGRNLPVAVRAKEPLKLLPAATHPEKHVMKRKRAPDKKAQASRAAAPVRAKARKPGGGRRLAPSKAAAQTRSTTSSFPSLKAVGKAEFRELLVRTVQPGEPDRKQERRQRVSVRVSKAEERRLQQRARQAGLTVSDYLRRAALEAELSPSKAEHGQECASRLTAAAPMFAASAHHNNSLLGGWLGLLRNRFLASPTRFAERA